MASLAHIASSVGYFGLTTVNHRDLTYPTDAPTATWCVLHLLFAVARNPSLCLIWSRWSDIAKVSLCCCLTKALQISFCLPEEIALCFVVFGMRLQCLLRLGCRPLCFSVDRSQSCLRIATTASPVSAADLKST